MGFESDIRKQLNYLLRQLDCIKRKGCLCFGHPPDLAYNKETGKLSATFVDNTTKSTSLDIPTKTSTLINDGETGDSKYLEGKDVYYQSRLLGSGNRIGNLVVAENTSRIFAIAESQTYLELSHDERNRVYQISYTGEGSQSYGGSIQLTKKTAELENTGDDGVNPFWNDRNTSIGHSHRHNLPRNPIANIITPNYIGSSTGKTGIDHFIEETVTSLTKEGGNLKYTDEAGVEHLLPIGNVQDTSLKVGLLQNRFPYGDRGLSNKEAIEGSRVQYHKTNKIGIYSLSQSSSIIHQRDPDFLTIYRPDPLSENPLAVLFFEDVEDPTKVYRIPITESVTSLTLDGNILKYTNELGDITSITLTSSGDTDYASLVLAKDVTRLDDPSILKATGNPIHRVFVTAYDHSSNLGSQELSSIRFYDESHRIGSFSNTESITTLEKVDSDISPFMIRYTNEAGEVTDISLEANPIDSIWTDINNPIKTIHLKKGLHNKTVFLGEPELQGGVFPQEKRYFYDKVNFSGVTDVGNILFIHRLQGDGKLQSDEPLLTMQSTGMTRSVGGNSHVQHLPIDFRFVHQYNNLMVKNRARIDYVNEISLTKSSPTEMGHLRSVRSFFDIYSSGTIRLIQDNAQTATYIGGVTPPHDIYPNDRDILAEINVSGGRFNLERRDKVISYKGDGFHVHKCGYTFFNAPLIEGTEESVKESDRYNLAFLVRNNDAEGRVENVRGGTIQKFIGAVALKTLIRAGFNPVRGYSRSSDAGFSEWNSEQEAEFNRLLEQLGLNFSEDEETFVL